MKTRLSTVSHLKQVFTETLLNNTDKVSKISDNSVLNGVAFGVAKVSQKAIKDIALVESHIMVDSANGSQLDEVAESRGISPRFSASQSSTYIRVIGDVGTVYTKDTNVFSGPHGQIFDIETTTTIGDNGFAYVKVRSQEVGENQNVDALSLVKVTPEPSGHEFCINEYAAFGGRDTEDDDLFRKRIKEGANLAATDTISKLTQVINKINNNVVRVIYQGTNAQSQVILAVVTHNGIDLTDPELNEIEVSVGDFLSLADLKPYGQTGGNIELRNIEYQPIDIMFRTELRSSFDPDLVRKDIQVQMSKSFDFRFWKPGDRVEWDELLSIARDTQGVKSVPDTTFYPNSDVLIDKNKLPRIRSFMMLDLNGNIISNVEGTLNPIYYPTNPDSSFQQTILASI